MSLQVGDRLGDWVVDRPLGEGGMGSVYRCHSVLADDVLAAVKVLKGSDVGAVDQRFVQELRTLSGLNHPAIVRVQGGGRDEARGLLYLAMELVDGEDLADRLARGPLSPEETVDVFGPVADALAYAHGRGVAHRDIKPSNIMLRSDGTPVIVDFGIAVAAGRTRFTREGQVPGTAVYLPPETFEGEIPDPLGTDAYALGVVMWEAITGEPPFAADPTSAESQQLVQVMGLKLRGDALDIGDKAPDHIRQVVLRTTEPEPGSRLTDLNAVRDLLTTGRTAVPLPVPRKRKRRTGCAAAVVGLAALATAVAGIAVASGVGWWMWRASDGPVPVVRDIRPAVALGPTLEEAARALEGGELDAARRSAGLAVDDHPEDPNANLLYGQVLLAGGQGLLARPYLCAAAAGGLADQVPGLDSGDLSCDRGPGATIPLTAPLAVARVDLSSQLAGLSVDGMADGGALAEKSERKPARGRDADVGMPAAEMAPAADTGFAGPAAAAPVAAPPPSAPAPAAAAKPAPASRPAPAPSSPPPPPADTIGGSETADGIAFDFEDDAVSGDYAPSGGSGGGVSAKADAASPVQGDATLISVDAAGPLGADDAEAVLKRALSGLESCHESGLRRNDSLSGPFDLVLVVSAAGTVTSVEVVANGTGDAELQRCVVAKLQRLRFTGTDGVTTLQIRVVFAAR